MRPDYEAIGRVVWAHIRKRALSRVAWAVKYGHLPRITPETRCVHCGGPAAIYEHRDYSRPLDVVPACDSCNQLAGSAALDISALRSIVTAGYRDHADIPSYRAMAAKAQDGAQAS